MNKESINYQASAADQGSPLDRYLRAQGISRHFLIRLRNQDQVLLNGRIQPFHTPLREGDLIEVDPYLREESTVIPEGMDLDILYEDTDFLAINKPAGVLSHPLGDKEPAGTIANGVRDYLLRQDITAIHPVNRLDRTTSGIILFAKHPIAQHHLIQHKPIKEYMALAEGILREDHGVIDAPIAKIDAPSIRRIVTPTGQPSQTEYQVISTGDNHSLLRITLHTGRTHQIRVHLSHIGHPLVGDFLYGKENAPRLLLHAWRLTFHPLRSVGPLVLTAPLPGLFEDYLVS